MPAKKCGQILLRALAEGEWRTGRIWQAGGHGDNAGSRGTAAVGTHARAPSQGGNEQDLRRATEGGWGQGGVWNGSRTLVCGWQCSSPRQGNWRREFRVRTDGTPLSDRKAALRSFPPCLHFCSFNSISYYDPMFRSNSGYI